MSAQAQLDDTDMSDPQGQQDPSMEEILASIRRIISEGDEEPEGGEAAAAAPPPQPEPEEEEVFDLTDGEPADDVLDLTTAVADDGTVVDLNRNEPEEVPTMVVPEPEPEPESPPEPEPEPEPLPQPEPEPVLEMVPEPEPEPEPIPEPEPAPPPSFASAEMQPPPTPMMSSDSMLSAETADETRDAFAELAQAVHDEPQPVAQVEAVPVGDGARTLEEMVMESLRPMLKGWLDQNLPDMVERLVKEEISKLSRR